LEELQNALAYLFTETKEESTEYNNNLITSMSAGVLVFAILVIGMSCLAKYGKLMKMLCCSVTWRGEERTLDKNVPEIFNQLVKKDQGGATKDAGPKESHEMMSLWKQ